MISPSNTAPLNRSLIPSVPKGQYTAGRPNQTL